MAERLILGNFIRVVNFSVINPARVNVERETKQLFAHDRTFQMPARRTFAPRRIPFHLADFARRGLAPDREIRRMALAVDSIDPALKFFGAIFGDSARQPAVIGHGRRIEIKPAIEFVAMFVSNGLGKLDHVFNIIGSDRPCGRLADIQRLHIIPIGMGIMFGDLPDIRLFALACLFGRHFFQLVLAFIGIIGQVAHIGNIDDMGELVTLPAQRPPQNIRKDVSAHIADMRIIIDRRPAGIHARLAGMDGHECFETAGQAVEQL